MQLLIKRFVVTLAVALLPLFLRGGTLDGAPFRIVSTNADWKIDDSKVQPMGEGVSLVASLNNTSNLIKSVVIKSDLKGPSANALNELAAGMRDSFSNPAVKKLAEADTTFLGYKAKTFTYQITQGDQIIHNVAILFVTGTNGWTIAAVGRPE